MSWAYWRSLNNGSFGYGEVGYRLALKRPLGKKPLEELSLFAPKKEMQRGGVRYRIASKRLARSARSSNPPWRLEKERSEGGRDRAG